jgi:hypothetical protein
VKPDIKVGSKVRDKYDRTALGVVVAINFIDDLADVEWNGNEADRDFDLDQLVLYDPLAEKLMVEGIQSKVDAAKSAFEEAFAKWQEAQDLAAKDNYNIDDLKYMNLINMKDFEQVINNSGWLSSGVRSLYC